MKEKIYQSPPVGQEISCVMKGIKKSILLQEKKLKLMIIQLLKEDNFGVVGVREISFKPYGYTLLVLLSESHLAIHTYPEYNSFYFNMYSCRGPNDAEKTFNLLREKLNPASILFLNKNKIPIK